MITALLRGERVQLVGQEITARAQGTAAEVPVLVAALGKRLLRVAGQLTSGTITWMANALGRASMWRPVSPCGGR